MPKKILILGAGYSGIRVASVLRDKKEDFEAIIIDENTYHTDKTCLHEVAAGQLGPDKISYPIDDCVGGKVSFLQDKVLEIDKDRQEVKCQKSGILKYDYLVVSLGFESETFNIKGVCENSLSMVNLDEAITIHNNIIKEFEAYSKDKDKKHLSISVIGAGFTGIELVGALIEELPKYAKKYGFNEKDAEIYCIEAAKDLLPMFSRKLANYAIDYLTKKGVRFVTCAPVSEVKPNTVVYKCEGTDKEIHSNTIIWTTGVSGSHLIGEAHFDARRGRVIVKSDLTVDGYDNIWMLGDVSAVMDPITNRPYPTTAQIALAMADVCVENILDKINGRPVKTFKYLSKGTVCSLGNGNAIGQIGDMEVKGYIASVLKKIIATRSVFLGSRRFYLMLAKGRYDLYK